MRGPSTFSCFFFNDTATTEIYTLSLHDALPISCDDRRALNGSDSGRLLSSKSRSKNQECRHAANLPRTDRKSTRLNSSHLVISYAVFCLKKKNYPRAHDAPPDRYRGAPIRRSVA